jgi:hypothetical protein
MRIPFKIEKLVTTKLSFDEIVQELENKNSIKYFGGLRIDKYRFSIDDNRFYIQRNSYGIDASLEYFPLIKGEVVNENPFRIYIELIPSYLAIVFFFVIALLFFIAGVFINNWTINGIKRAPLVYERLLIVLFGSGIPLLWCYLQYIRPIKKAKTWIFEKLQLIEFE